MTQVQHTIIEQVLATTPSTGRRQFDFFTDGELTVRVSTAAKNRGARYYFNTDITYNVCHDLYDVKVHRIDRRTLEHETREHERIFCDTLGELVLGRYWR